MVKLTSSMEQQYASAQDTIKALEGKVGELERVVKEREREREEREREKEREREREREWEKVEVVKEETRLNAVQQEEGGQETPQSLTLFLTDWKKSVEGQWSSIKEEWVSERERMKRVREEWETKIRTVDTGLDKINQIHGTTMGLVKEVQGQKGEVRRIQERVWRDLVGGGGVGGVQVGNGDVVKGATGSGLVTPPSPRSQSSDSEGRSGSSGGAGSGRRRKRRSVSEGRGRMMMLSGARKLLVGEREEDGEESDDDDATLAEEGSGGLDAVKVTEGSSTSSTKTRTTKLKGSDEHDGDNDGMGNVTTVSRAYHLPFLLDIQKERVFDDDYYEDSGSSVFASEDEEEEEEEEGRKVPGPRNRRRTGGVKTKGKVKVKSTSLPGAMPTPESSLAASDIIVVPRPGEASATSMTNTKSVSFFNFHS
jgi:hypothetical protein